MAAHQVWLQHSGNLVSEKTSSRQFVNRGNLPLPKEDKCKYFCTSFSFGRPVSQAFGHGRIPEADRFNEQRENR
jgi:hypothetical protein